MTSPVIRIDRAGVYLIGCPARGRTTSWAQMRLSQGESLVLPLWLSATYLGQPERRKEGVKQRVENFVAGKWGWPVFIAVWLAAHIATAVAWDFSWPVVFGKGFLAGALMTVFADWRMGIVRRKRKEWLDGHGTDGESDPGSTPTGASSGTDVSTTAGAGTGGVLTVPSGSITIHGAIGTTATARAIAAAVTGTAGGGAGSSVSKFARGGFLGRTSSLSPATLHAMESQELDVYTAPVWGFRSWKVTPGLPVLVSLNQGLAWKPGRNEAICMNEDSYVAGSSYSPLACDGNIPNPYCGCGFYALRDFFDAVSYGSGGYESVGGVVGWGKVIDGSNGWRAQYAAVAALLALPVIKVKDVSEAIASRLQFIANLYHVPLVSTIEDLVDETRKLAEWMEGRGGEDET